MCNLAQCYAALGAYSKKKKLLEKALVMREKLFGRHSPVLAPLCMDLAQCCEKLDDQERRRTLVEKARDIWTKEYGPDDANVAWCMTILAEFPEREEPAEVDPRRRTGPTSGSGCGLPGFVPQRELLSEWGGSNNV